MINVSSLIDFAAAFDSIYLTSFSSIQYCIEYIVELRTVLLRHRDFRVVKNFCGKNLWENVRISGFFRGVENYCGKSLWENFRISGILMTHQNFYA